MQWRDITEVEFNNIAHGQNIHVLANSKTLPQKAVVESRQGTTLTVSVKESAVGGFTTGSHAVTMTRVVVPMQK